MMSMTALRPVIRSLVLLFALAGVPSLLLAQAPTTRPKSGESRPKAERPGSTRQPSAEARRPERGQDRSAADRNRPPARSTGEPELKRRKP